MRYKITIEYDGTKLLGWQRQEDGPTAQGYLEKALNAFAGKYVVFPEDKYYRIKTDNNDEDLDASTGKLLKISTKTIIQGAGRTDAGVHALSQVAHFDLNKDIDHFRIREAFNAQLRNIKAPVVVLEAERVDENFHARFSAKGRGYIYRILNRRAPAALEKNRVWWVPAEIDIERMKRGAELLLGHHDFSSFRAAACQALSPMKTLDKLEISTFGEEIIFTVEARSFLHHQVRNIVGTLKMIGDGHINPENIPTILEAKNRSAAGPTAPAHGLYLNKVIY